MSIITKGGTPAKGSPTVFTLNKADLLANSVVSGDTYFSSSDNWNTVVLLYSSSEGNQKERVAFDATVTTPTANFSVDLTARDVFEITQITIYDKQSGFLEIPRVDLTTADFDVDMTEVISSPNIEQLVADSFVSSTSSNNHLHQSFLVGASDVEASKVTLKLHRGAGTSGNIKVNIHEADGSDNIGNQIVQSANVAISTMTTNVAGADVEFVWSSPPTLTAGARYTFVVDMVGISTSDIFTHKSTTSEYADGVFYKFNGSTWTAEAGDSYFILSLTEV